jgi:hypothetical protein
MWRPSLGCANLRKAPPLVAFQTAATLFCVAAEGAKTHVIEENGVRLEYASIVPPADVIFALGQAVYARTVVPRFLHRAPPHVLRVMLVDAERISFTDVTNTIWVSYGRLKARRPGTDPLSLVHETTHVVASGPRDQDRTLTEGLAVYVQQVDAEVRIAFGPRWRQMLIEKVSQQRFGLFCKERLFAPLKLSSPQFGFQVIPNRASLYTICRRWI